MKAEITVHYLFFDIECANCFDNCGKISSFGYVLTDDKFKVLLKKDIIMNPAAKFDWYLLNHNMVRYPVEKFTSAEKFPVWYKDLKALLEAKDTFVVGYAVENDVKFLCDECNRYKLPTFSFTYYDAQTLFKSYNDIHAHKEALSKSMTKLGIYELGFMDQHKSDDDAEMTMLVAKKMCDNLGISLSELIGLVPHSKGNVDAYLKSFVKELNDPKKTHTKGLKFKMLYRLMDVGVPQKGSVKLSEIAGQTITFTKEFEFFQYYKAAYLIQKLINAGGIYSPDARKCTLFVQVENTVDSRVEAVVKAIDEGKKAQIVNLAGFLKLLKITKEQFEKESDGYDLTYVLTEAEKKQNHIV